MNVSRRDFISLFGAGAAAAAVPGCMCVPPCRVNAKLGVSLHSIREYIGGKKGADGSVLAPGVGLVKAFRALSAIGYKGVEFSDYYGNDAKTLKTMLDDSGLVACGSHAGAEAFGPDKIAETCEFNLGFGNNLIVSDGDFPKKGENLDDFLRKLVDYYNTAAATAAKYGCRIGLCSHADGFTVKTSDGTAYWDYFFTHVDPLVCMEQSVAWTAKAGVDPCEQFRKFPHRSPTLRVQEAGTRGAVPVDWESLVPIAAKDGVAWFVVACEYPCDDLSAVLRSHNFFRAKIVG